MARVIEEIPPVEKQVVCDNCGRTIAYVKNDIRVSNGTHMGDSCGSEWIKCPASDCLRAITLRSW